VSYLVDTDWVIDGLGGHGLEVLDRLSEHGLAVSMVTLGEVFEGAHVFPDPEEKLRAYREFLSGYRVLPVSEGIMERFAGLRAGLRRQGTLIPDFDLVIAATALEHGLTLLTRNTKHFTRVPAIQLY
jgi:tRNA(fMet)-specific endonuclease VapC